MPELALNGRAPVCWGAAFHAQQAGEKALEALLTFHGVEFARSHDIDYLTGLCIDAEPHTEWLRHAVKACTRLEVHLLPPSRNRDPDRDPLRQRD